MVAQLTPEALQDLMALRARIEAAPHGSSTALVHEFAARTGKNPNTIYTWLKAHAGFKPARKKRSDAGKTALPEDTLHFIAAAKKEALRGNGKATLPTAVAMNIAHVNGIEVPVSESRVNAVLRERRLDLKAQAVARSHIQLRTEYPNQLHQIDPSLCLIYYTPKGQAIMRDEEFYKNKPAALDKVRLKVWRYVRYDHASGCIDVRYFEAAGENQQSLFDFLLWTWGQQANRLSFGVCKGLLWDKGSANTSHGIKNLLDAMGVQHQTHAQGHSWGKGGVEQGNNLVETHFESRLRFEPVDSVAQLNAAAEAWVRDFNANNITHVDCRVRRGSGEPMVRDDLWQLIMRTPGALVAMPERDVCAWFMVGQDHTRLVRDLRISFAHPEIKASRSYDLSAYAEFLGNGQKLKVTPVLLQGGALRVEIERLGKEPLLVQVAPDNAFDDFGRPLSATVVGDYAKAPQSAAEAASDKLAATAWGQGTTADMAEDLRAKQSRPFAHLNDGKGLVAHSHLGQGELPTRLMPTAAELSTAQLQQHALVVPKAQIMLTVPEAVRSIKAAFAELGHDAPADLYAQISAAHPSGHVPGAWADTWAANHVAAATQATGTHEPKGFGLRRVK
jgi:hypothetical protein